MDAIDLITHDGDLEKDARLAFALGAEDIPAAGIFGYLSPDPIARKRGTKRSSYIRDIEQMPLFSPPEIDEYVMRYVASNIGSSAGSS